MGDERHLAVRRKSTLARREEAVGGGSHLNCSGTVSGSAPPPFVFLCRDESEVTDDDTRTHSAVSVLSVCSPPPRTPARLTCGFGQCAVKKKKRGKKGRGGSKAEEEPLVLTLRRDPIQLPDAADPFLFFPHHNPSDDICSHFGKKRRGKREKKNIVSRK